MDQWEQWNLNQNKKFSVKKMFFEICKMVAISFWPQCVHERNVDLNDGKYQVILLLMSSQQKITNSQYLFN